MNKKELHNMKLLEATDELIKLAKEDVPVRDKRYYTEQLIYTVIRYITCDQVGDQHWHGHCLVVCHDYLWPQIRVPCIHYILIKRTMFLKGMITGQRNGQIVCWIRPFSQNGYIRKILI